MALKNINEILEKLDGLWDERKSLAEALTEDGDINDWCTMLRLGPMLTGIKYEVLVYYDLMYLIGTMENEKDRFEVQKVKKYHEGYLEDDIKNKINIGRTWELRDYRCREWQKRLEKIMCDIYDYFFGKE